MQHSAESSRGNRILVVDDNAAIHDDFRKVLQSDNSEAVRRLRQMEQSILGSGSDDSKDIKSRDFAVDFAFQGEEALNLVEQSEADGEPYALVFMDVRMPPGWDGIETIRRIWEKFPHIEMVICTAYSDYSWEEILARLGNADRLLFLRKPFDTVAVKQMASALTEKWRLSRQVDEYVTQLEFEVSERRKSEERLQFETSHDRLTGLTNRMGLGDELRKAIDQAEESGERAALLYVNLDRFKECNDTLGYDNGDLIIKEIGTRLNECMRKRDTVARLSADEFAVLIPVMDDPEDLAGIAQRIQKALASPIFIESLRLEMRACISVVIFPDHGSGVDELMRRADKAMLEAKKSDSGVIQYHPRFDRYSPDKLTLLAELKSAIHENNLVLYYQPRIDLKAGTVNGFEGLIRWPHPQRGLLLPGEFISFAERSGLRKPMSFWIVNEGARQWSEWAKKGMELSLSLNLSARDLMDSDLPEAVGAILEDHDMNPERLVLEITESAMMEDPARALETMRSLSGMGVRLSIDDFGIGYSSLAYLKNSPVKELKIDRSFIFDMSKNSNDMTIVRSTIELGHTLGLTVVAEGVEQSCQLDLLKRMGCDAAQGYYISKPKPWDDAEKWLQTTSWPIEVCQK